MLFRVCKVIYLNLLTLFLNIGVVWDVALYRLIERNES